MAITSPVLTDAEVARVRDAEPTLSNRPPGVDLAAKINTLAAEAKADTEANAAAGSDNTADLAAMVSGTATILNGNTSVTVTAATLGGTFGGSPVQLTWAESPGTGGVLYATWSTDDLVINCAADPGADTDVYFSVDGR